MHKLRQVIVLLLGSLLAPLASAQVQINGFGQVIGGGVTHGDGLLDVSYDEDVSFAAESLFALQLTAPLSSRWDAIGQVVARGREDYAPEFSWAYLRYQINPNWSVKAGRQRIRFHHYSDYLEVGSAYPFLRPPRSIYSLGLNDFEGLNLTGSHAVGDWALNAHIAAGGARNVTEAKGRSNTELESRQSVGLILEARYDDWLNLRAIYTTARASIRNAELTQLFDALRASGEADVARELDFEDERGTHLGLGAELQSGPWTVGTEYSHFDFDDTFTGGRRGYSGMVAYRWRDWTPVLTYGRVYGHPGQDAVNAMNPAHPLFAAVAGLSAVSELDDRYLSIGARYDLTESLAIKVDYTHRTSGVEGIESSGLFASGLVFTF